MYVLSFFNACVEMCERVRAQNVAHVVFELMANHCAFARPYVSTRSYIHHLSQNDANLALLS